MLRIDKSLIRVTSFKFLLFEWPFRNFQKFARRTGRFFKASLYFDVADSLMIIPRSTNCTESRPKLTNKERINHGWPKLFQKNMKQFPEVQASSLKLLILDDIFRSDNSYHPHKSKSNIVTITQVFIKNLDSTIIKPIFSQMSPSTGTFQGYSWR